MRSSILIATSIMENNAILKSGQQVKHSGVIRTVICHIATTNKYLLSGFGPPVTIKEFEVIAK